MSATLDNRCHIAATRWSQRVGEDEEIGEFADNTQADIGHDLQVRPPRTQDAGQYHALYASVGVIADNDGGPGVRNRSAYLLRPPNPNPLLIEEALDERMLVHPSHFEFVVAPCQFVVAPCQRADTEHPIEHRCRQSQQHARSARACEGR
jgi:hypothetical protein